MSQKEKEYGKEKTGQGTSPQKKIYIKRRRLRGTVAALCRPFHVSKPTQTCSTDGTTSTTPACCGAIVVKKTMWNCIVNRSDSSVAVNGRCQVPSTRCKHAICYDVDKNRVYLLGGRNGNIPLKDFWTYSIGMQLHVNFISCVHLRLLMCIFLVLVPH